MNVTYETQKSIFNIFEYVNPKLVSSFSQVHFEKDLKTSRIAISLKYLKMKLVLPNIKIL